jgi:hypothetical protein
MLSCFYVRFDSFCVELGAMVYSEGLGRDVATVAGDVKPVGVLGSHDVVPALTAPI